jgi:hypothetical protein
MIRVRRSASTAAVMLAVTLTGCAGIESGRGLGPGPAQVARASQQGVRDALAQMSGEEGPDPRGSWTAPVVQEVWVPARILDAVFIPAHHEWVVIHPDARGTRHRRQQSGGRRVQGLGSTRARPCAVP